VDPVSRPWTVGVPWITLLCAVAASEWGPVFGWWGVEWRVVAATLLATAVAVSVHRWRPGDLVGASLLSLILLFWFVSVFVLGDTVAGFVPSGAAFGDVLSGVINGGARILSVPLPVPSTGGVLVLPVALTWLCTTMAVEWVLRSRHPLGATAPPIVLYGVAVVFGIGAPGSRLVLSGTVAALVLVAAGLSSMPAVVGERTFTNRRIRRRRYGGIAVAVAVVAAAALVLGPSLPGVSSGTPYDPRAERVPPPLPVPTANPLDELSAWARTSGGPTFFSVHTSRPAPLRLAVLDQYSPVEGWTDSGRYEPAGRVLPAPAPAEPRVTVSQSVSLAGLPGPWLPAVEQPVLLTGIRALVDPSTGVLVAAAGPAARTYRVVSAYPTGAGGSCTAGSTVVPPVVTPPVPAPVAALARQYTAGATSPCAEAVALVQAFKDHYTYDADASSGSSVAVLENFVAGPAPEGGKGTAEQFASAYALMAESLSLEARVVVGFFPSRQTAPGTYVVGPGDATAWVEIHFADEGWVPFFPQAPTGGVPPGEATAEQRSAVGPGTRAGAATTAPVAPSPAARAPAPARDGGGGVLVAVAVSVAAVVVILLSVGGLVAAVRRRRRRRRLASGDARRQVIGAWQEALDSLRAAGVRPRASDTAEEVVMAGAARLGGVPTASASLAALGALSNLSRFSGTPVSRDDADLAWQYAEEVGTSVREGMGPGERLRSSLDVRLLRADSGR